MTLLQKLLARLKSWLFVEESKEVEPEGKKFEPVKVDPAGRFEQTSVLMKKPRTPTFADIDRFEQRQAQNRLARHQEQKPAPTIIEATSFERSRAVTLRTISEPAYCAPEPTYRATRLQSLSRTVLLILNRHGASPIIRHLLPHLSLEINHEH